MAFFKKSSRFSLSLSLLMAPLIFSVAFLTTVSLAPLSPALARATGDAQPSLTSGSCASGYSCVSGCFAPSIAGPACAGGVCCKPGPSAGDGTGGGGTGGGGTGGGGGTPAAGGGGTPAAGSGSGTPAASPQSINFTNPLAFNTVEEVLDSILSTLRGIIVILALVFLVIGAVLYITSAGDEGRMKTAKGAITAAMIGLAIGLAAPSFLKEIGTVLGWGAVNSTAVAGAATLSQIATSVLNFLLSIVGVLAIIMLVVGAIMYLTAAGDEDRIDTGKKIVTYSIIGIAVALSALVIVSQIAAFFV